MKIRRFSWAHLAVDVLASPAIFTCLVAAGTLLWLANPGSYYPILAAWIGLGCILGVVRIIKMDGIETEAEMLERWRREDAPPAPADGRNTEPEATAMSEATNPQADSEPEGNGRPVLFWYGAPYSVHPDPAGGRGTPEQAGDEARRRTAELQGRAGSKGALAGMLEDLRQFGG